MVRKSKPADMVRTDILKLIRIGIMIMDRVNRMFMIGEDHLMVARQHTKIVALAVRQDQKILECHPTEL
jgi:hypothetical protein